MKKVLSVAIAGLCLMVGTGRSAAQTKAPDPKVRVEVLVSRYEGDRKTATQPFLFLLALNQKGSLRVDADPGKPAPSSAPGPCIESGVLQPVATQVETTVVPSTADRFTVSMQFTDRALAGCRNVGGVSIPVFSIRSISDQVSLKDAETAEIALEGDKLRNESVKVSVRLTIGNE